jgi:DNA-binding transcriptional MocR family regulator
MRARALVDLLGSWSSGRDPLNEQLAAALQRLVEQGTLPSGTRVPSERELSTALGVSRTTVVAAFDRLRTAGLLRSRRGSGTRVALREQRPAPAPRANQAALADLVPRDGGLSVPGSPIQLTIGASSAPPLVADEIERAALEDVRPLLRSFGYLPAGLPALSEAIAAHLTRTGLPTTPDQILVTSGAQQAIDLVARVLVGPAGSVILENPTYPGAILAFRGAGAALTPVPVDEDGMLVELVRLHAERRPRQLVYVVPSFHNPTGAVLSADRRAELVRIATEYGLMVVEDLTAADLSFGAEPPPPLATLDTSEQVLTIGSLSKIAWGGLRVGWIRAPRQMIGRLAAAKAEVDLGSSLLSQIVAVRLLGRMDELLAIVRTAGAERLAIMEAGLRDHLPSWSWTRPSGGFCLWPQLPLGDGTSFARLASEFGVIVRPGATLSVDGSFTDRIRIAFGEEPPVLREAVHRLAEAWAAYEPSAPRVRIEAAISV